MSIKIKGAEKLMKKLRRLERSGARRALRNATRAGTAVILKAVRKEVPTDEGLLKKAQTSKIIGRGMNMGGIVGADVAKLASDAAADASRPTNIDHLVNFGHVAPDGKIIPPNGYMQRATSAMPAAESRFVEVLAAGIEREAMR